MYKSNFLSCKISSEMTFRQPV